jgi:hypothetical protein
MIIPLWREGGFCPRETFVLGAFVLFPSYRNMLQLHDWYVVIMIAVCYSCYIICSNLKCCKWPQKWKFLQRHFLWTWLMNLWNIIQLLHFIECNMMFYGALKSNIDQGQSAIIVLLHLTYKVFCVPGSIFRDLFVEFLFQIQKSLS